MSGLATSETTSIPAISLHKKLNILEVGTNLGVKMMRQAQSKIGSLPHLLADVSKWVRDPD